MKSQKALSSGTRGEIQPYPMQDKKKKRTRQQRSSTTNAGKEKKNTLNRTYKRGKLAGCSGGRPEPGGRERGKRRRKGETPRLREVTEESSNQEGRTGCLSVAKEKGMAYRVYSEERSRTRRRKKNVVAGQPRQSLMKKTKREKELPKGQEGRSTGRPKRLPV